MRVKTKPKKKKKTRNDPSTLVRVRHDLKPVKLTTMEPFFSVCVNHFNVSWVNLFKLDSIKLSVHPVLSVLQNGNDLMLYKNVQCLSNEITFIRSKGWLGFT